MKIAAAVLFILFPVLVLLPFPAYHAVDFDRVTSVNQVYAYFNAKTSMISLLLPLVYIGMGIFSMKKQRGSIYGDE
jgi:predicted transporter